VLFDRVDDTKPRIRIVSGQQHDFNRRLRLRQPVVQPQQSADKWKRDPGFKSGILLLALVLAIRVNAFLPVDLVGV
jgi:hypothetical protein